MIRKTLLAVLALAGVLAAFGLWRAGRMPLAWTDADLLYALREPADERRLELALRQLAARPDLLPLATPLLRRLVDHRSVPVRRALGQLPLPATASRLLLDRDESVRRRAAVSLARLGDAASRPILLAMLRPLVLYAGSGGVLQWRARPLSTVREGGALYRIAGTDARSPVEGVVSLYFEPEGAELRPGQRVLELAPTESAVQEALAGLAEVGTTADEPDIERVAARYPAAEDLARYALASIRARTLVLP